MDRSEAYRFLANELASYRKLTYDELAQLVGRTYSHRLNSGGLEYVIDIDVAWLNREGGQILVDGMVGGTSWGGPLARFDDHRLARSA